MIDNSTGGVLAMVGGFDYEKEPFNLATNGQRQPGSSFKPFTLVTALQEGHSTSEVLHLGAAGDPLRGPDPGQKNGGTKVVTDIFEVTNYERPATSGRRRSATATTYSDNSVYAQLGPRSGPTTSPTTANEMGIQTDLSTENEYSIDGGPFEPYNPALILGGLEIGVTPLEMAYAYSTLGRRRRARQRHDGLEPGRAGPVGILEVNEAPEDGEDPLDARRRQDGRLGRERGPDRAGARRGRGRRPPSACSRRSSRRDRRARRYRRLRVGQDRHDRRTTATPGSAAGPRTSPRASGSATRQHHADGDRVRRRPGRRRDLSRR